MALDPWKLTLGGTGPVIETRVRDIIRGNNHKPDDGSNPPEEWERREEEEKRNVNLKQKERESKTFSSIAVNEI